MYDKAIFLGVLMLHIYFPWYYTYRTRVSACFTKDEYWILNILSQLLVYMVCGVVWCVWFGMVWKVCKMEKARTTIHACTLTKYVKSDFPSFFFFQLSFLSIHTIVTIVCDHHCHHLSIAVHTHTYTCTQPFVVCGLCTNDNFYNVHKSIIHFHSPWSRYMCLDVYNLSQILFTPFRPKHSQPTIFSRLTIILLEWVEVLVCFNFLWLL